MIPIVQRGVAMVITRRKVLFINLSYSTMFSFIRLLLMCTWPAAAMPVNSSLAPSDVSALVFEDHLAINILRKDLAEKNLTISFEEVAYLPLEPKSRRENACKNSLTIDYPKFVYAISERNGCDINELADVPLGVLSNRVFYEVAQSVPERHVSHSFSGIPDTCLLSKISGHCPAYLVYAECVYTKYIRRKNATTTVVLPSSPLGEGTFKVRFSQYLQRVSGNIPPLLELTVEKLCRFVNTACGSLHPQFRHSYDFKIQHVCSVFDVFTPLVDFGSLFDPSVPEEELLALKVVDDQHYEDLFATSIDLIFSPLGVPYDANINDKSDLVQYHNEICEKRCAYVGIMAEMTSSWTKLSDLGRQRQLMICAKILALCNACANCDGLDVYVPN
ncbi:uncharacterized protein BXIN_0884 [Babesia sp. Xinjiang]|uniref:uncharacterized protein n=1 Tax=Babesia sp. Xinjiang TaxID=462227 RepID=UPI000A22F192|nr:uncharacterized protein BXIN_0884 [Babesia sp. Xinjiang]ORM41225.1 hypothetical protein BXIN_0884 [Babesia sp. Xinjiang]